jgi:hypothetical protein
MLQQIRNYLKSTPFRPFMIHASSGENFPVDHPESAAIVGQNVLVLLPDGENSIALWALHIIGVSGAENVAA